MRVLNVNSSLDFKTGGGTAERTFQMSRFLAGEGTECTVLTIDTGLDEARIHALEPAKVLALPILWRRFYLPKISWKTITGLVNNADIIHLMGHWGVLNALVYIAVRRAGKPYVVCPAGALPIFGRSSRLKRLYNFVIGNAIIRNASAWIAVTPAEFPQFESYGIPASQVAVIANGICKDDFSSFDIVQFRNKNNLPDVPVILFMGRLNLIKGPDLLLQAFASAHEHMGDYHLVFAGPDEGMQFELHQAARQAGIAERVHFLGFVSGSDKAAAYHLASLLVVPSRQEAMSIVALEAGICGIPVMVTDQCGFDEIRSIDPVLEVPANATGIAHGLVQLVTEPDRLSRIGPALQTFVSQRYEWTSIVVKYLNLYKIILAMPVQK
ncbi:glycosyltransferase [Noviherbaspirillum sedimenti]|uniref:Glycosyltransferase n=1 Tax=Noviherbaspirillum sedimenti TaxID=2320865 RepID=A0A3A3GPL3_9BURK|nr:glycosyltransferase [Noviherbaspirillum sedimenti]RJG02930.1 glycosyltransferase [Noviherbaspirillum sedimenti]